jgi:hypothetical protein
MTEHDVRVVHLFGHNGGAGLSEKPLHVVRQHR